MSQRFYVGICALSAYAFSRCYRKAKNSRRSGVRRWLTGWRSAPSGSTGARSLPFSTPSGCGAAMSRAARPTRLKRSAAAVSPALSGSPSRGCRAAILSAATASTRFRTAIRAPDGGSGGSATGRGRNGALISRPLKTRAKSRLPPRPRPVRRRPEAHRGRASSSGWTSPCSTADRRRKQRRSVRPWRVSG